MSHTVRLQSWCVAFPEQVQRSSRPQSDTTIIFHFLLTLPAVPRQKATEKGVHHDITLTPAGQPLRAHKDHPHKWRGRSLVAWLLAMGVRAGLLGRNAPPGAVHLRQQLVVSSIVVPQRTSLPRSREIGHSTADQQRTHPCRTIRSSFPKTLKTPQFLVSVRRTPPASRERAARVPEPLRRSPGGSLRTTRQHHRAVRA